jgi:membrane protein implicated in regulation of membrane protease activity
MFPIPMSILWLAALIVFGIVEGVTVGLASIWFCAGALVALIASLLGAGLWVQVALFLIVSFLALILFRPLARKYLSPNRQATNADRCIGAEGVVTQTIDNLKGQGQVNLAGQIWTARSDDDQRVFTPGTKIRVLRIEGVKVYVAPVESPSNPGKSQ